MKSENENHDKPSLIRINDSPKDWNEIQKKLFKNTHLSIKPYTLKELSEIYKVCTPTFKKMLEPYEQLLGEHTGRYYSITQVKLIFQYIDLPSAYTLKELAFIYQVSMPTFKAWLDRFQNELGEKTGHFYSLRQLYIIITKLDIPSVEGEEKDDLVFLLRICNNNLIVIYCYILSGLLV